METESPKPHTLGIDPSLLRPPSLIKIWLCRLCWFLLIAGLAAGAFFWFQEQRQQRSAEAQIEYRTEIVRRGDLVVTVTATGSLQPTNQVAVGSELSGNIQEVLVDWNEEVQEGQVLARLDISKLQAQVQQTQASLKAAQARVLIAQATIEETYSKLKQLERIRELSGGKNPSQFELDSAKAAAARARADKAVAEAGVAEVQARLDITLNELGKAEIFSPVNGIVLNRNIEPGQTVAASFSAPVLFELAEDLTQMELHVDVDEADIGQVKEGQEAVFTVDAYPRRTFSAVIRQVRFAATVTSGVVTYKTVLRVDNKDLALRPGMTATAEITVQKAEQALLIPAAALRFNPQAQEASRQQQGSFLDALMPRPMMRRERPQRPDSNERQGGGGPQKIWKLGQDGKPQELAVHVGLSDGSSVQVLRGDVEEGEQVITAAINARAGR